MSSNYPKRYRLAITWKEAREIYYDISARGEPEVIASREPQLSEIDLEFEAQTITAVLDKFRDVVEFEYIQFDQPVDGWVRICRTETTNGYMATSTDEYRWRHGELRLWECAYEGNVIECRGVGSIQEAIDCERETHAE